MACSLPDLDNSMPKHCDVQPQFVYESTIHSQNLLSTLNEQRKLGLLCDITVIVEGVELLAHKAVLAACSSYFSGIITDPANVSHNIVLELSSITRVGMENLLEFAYTSKLTVSKDNIDHVLSAARELEMKNLEYSCLNFLKQKLLQDTTETYIPSSCADSKSMCKNSTISRKFVSSSSNDEVSSCVSKPPSNDAQVTSTSSCPSMSQLSLEPKTSVLTAQTKFLNNSNLSSSTKPTQAFIKPLVSMTLPKNTTFPKVDHPTFFPTIFSSQHCEKSEAVFNMMSACSPSKPVSQLLCIPRGEVSATTIPTQIELQCKSNKYACSSSYNSDTDEALSADEDNERSYKCPLSAMDFSCKSKKYPDIELPLTVEEITKLPRSELQELLNKQPHLSVQQISAMNEIRRRGKNRIAAQRCRKRKMDCIRALQCELENLHKEYNELMGERRCVRDNMYKLVETFQQRYAQIFSDVLNPCGSSLNMATLNQSPDKARCVDQAVMSMAKFFKKEVEQAGNLAEHLSKLPCNNLPPLSFPCPLVNPDIIVVCDEEEKSSLFCYKPCSPGVCSTTSFSSDVTDSTAETTPMQDVTCSNTLLVQQPGLHQTESSEESFSSSSQEKRSDKFSQKSTLSMPCDSKYEPPDTSNT